MKIKGISLLLLSCALLILPVMLSGCENQQAPSQPTSSVAEPTQAPTETPSSEPEDEISSSEEPEPTESPIQTADFEEVFAANPIDDQLNNDLDFATSSSAILKAYESAGKRWKAMVSPAYASAKEVLPEDDRLQLEQEHQDWEDTIDDIIASIQEENSDSDDGKITSARLIQEKYKETVKGLCEIYFSSTGELPDFTAVMSDKPLG